MVKAIDIHLLTLSIAALSISYFLGKLGLNPIQDGLFRGCSRVVGGKKTPPPS